MVAIRRSAPASAAAATAFALSVGGAASSTTLKANGAPSAPSAPSASSGPSAPEPVLFNCDVEYDNWKTLWTPEWKAWCCEKRQRGCPETTTTSTSTFTVTATTSTTLEDEEGCEAICPFENKKATCQERITWSVKHLPVVVDSKTPCQAAHELVQKQCDSCSRCSLHLAAKAAGCDEEAEAALKQLTMDHEEQDGREQADEIAPAPEHDRATATIESDKGAKDVAQVSQSAEEPEKDHEKQEHMQDERDGETEAEDKIEDSTDSKEAADSTDVDVAEKELHQKPEQVEKEAKNSIEDSTHSKISNDSTDDAVAQNEVAEAPKALAPLASSEAVASDASEGEVSFLAAKFDIVEKSHGSSRVDADGDAGRSAVPTMIIGAGAVIGAAAMAVSIRRRAGVSVVEDESRVALEGGYDHFGREAAE